MMIKNTKEKIATVFLSMLKTQGVEQVSVSQLCNESGVSRETFYYHFQDKYDLMSWIYAKQKRTIMEDYFDSEPWSMVVCRVLKLVREYSSFYRQGFSSTAYQNLEKVMNDYTIYLFTNVIKDLTGYDTVPDDLNFYICFNSHGAVAMTKEWVESNMDKSEEELSNLIADAMPYKLKVYLDLHYQKRNMN